MTLTLSVSYIDAALSDVRGRMKGLARGTQAMRDLMAIETALLSAKARATTMEGKAL